MDFQKGLEAGAHVVLVGHAAPFGVEGVFDTVDSAGFRHDQAGNWNAGLSRAGIVPQYLAVLSHRLVEGQRGGAA